MSNETTQPDASETTAAPDPQPQKRVSRRGFLKAGAATGLTTAAGAYTVALPGAHTDTDAAPAPAAVIPMSEVHQMAAMPAPTNDLAGYTFFNPLMVDVISAAADRIIPADSRSPSATDSGVVYFIDRQLSSEYGMVGKRFGAGPFAVGAPTQGDQVGLTMRDRYRFGVDGMQAYAQQKYQKAFKDLTPDQQDQVLRDMEAGTATGFTAITPAAFFTLLVSHVKAGFFADPIYGGNRNMVGWRMIGYPGAQVVYQDWIGRYGVKFTGPYMSLADHQEALHPKAPAATPMPAAMGTLAASASPAATGAPGATIPAAMGTAAATGTSTSPTPAATVPATTGAVATTVPATTGAAATTTAPATTSTAATTAPATTGAAPTTVPATTGAAATTAPATTAPTATTGAQSASPSAAPTAPGATTAPAPAMAAPSATTAAQAMTGGTQVSVVMKDFSFAFDKGSVPPGDVTFNLVNQGQAVHNLDFTSLNKVSETIGPNQTTKFTVTFQPGMYDYICNIPGHAQLGMKGTLTVK